jgi:hypothetical protein
VSVYLASEVADGQLPDLRLLGAGRSPSLYRLEQRWPDAPFWAAAHEVGKDAAPLASVVQSATPVV